MGQKIVKVNSRLIRQNLRGVNPPVPPIEVYDFDGASLKLLERVNSLDFSGRIVYNPQTQPCGAVYIEVDDEG